MKYKNYRILINTMNKRICNIRIQHKFNYNEMKL